MQIRHSHIPVFEERLDFILFALASQRPVFVALVEPEEPTVIEQASADSLAGISAVIDDFQLRYARNNDCAAAAGTKYRIVVRTKPSNDAQQA